MTKYSIGPLHFSFSWSFEFRTCRHDRIFRVVDAYCRQNLNPDQLGVVSPIIEAQLYDDCVGVGWSRLQSARELAAVIRELQRRGYGCCLHEELVKPEELWEFFQWVGKNLLKGMETDDGQEYAVDLPPFAEPSDFYVEVYRWRYPGKLDREDWSDKR